MSIDDDALLARMYPSMMKPAAAPSAPAHSSNETPLFDSPDEEADGSDIDDDDEHEGQGQQPNEVADQNLITSELNDNARELLSRGIDAHATLRIAERAALNAGLSAGIDEAEAAANAAGWIETFGSFGVNAPDAEHFIALGARYMNDAPDDATMSEWVKDAYTELRSTYGADAAKALADAKALVATDPALCQFLDETGLGNHPRVVSVLAERARALRNAGGFRR